jgi:hypothetical protein
LQAPLEEKVRERRLFRTAGGGEERLQSGCELTVIGQGCDVHELLDLGDRHLVEGRDPPGESVDELIEVGVRHDAVHVAVRRRDGGRDVVPAEQDLQCPASSDQPGQPGHRAATRHGSDADLELAEDGRLAGEPDVGGEHELAAGAASPAPQG